MIAYVIVVAAVLSPKTNIDAELAYGSGQIDPVKAANPGLIYDAGEDDYINFLCGQGYSNKSLKLVTGDNTTSCLPSNNITVWELNYPSFALSAKANTSITRTFSRTVTNVGSPVSMYKAEIVDPSGRLDIKVAPTVLSFKSLGQKLTFVVTVGATTGKDVQSGSLTWDDGVYQVRSPIVAYGTSS